MTRKKTNTNRDKQIASEVALGKKTMSDIGLANGLTKQRIAAIAKSAGVSSPRARPRLGSHTNLDRRTEYMNILRLTLEELINTGKTIPQAAAEVNKSANCVRYMLSQDFRDIAWANATVQKHTTRVKFHPLK